jgi:hypothetical protein
MVVWSVANSFKLAYIQTCVLLAKYKFFHVPRKLLNKEEANYLVAKRKLGNHQVATALIGTGTNIVLAMLGIVVGKCIVNN